MPSFCTPRGRVREGARSAGIDWVPWAFDATICVRSNSFLLTHADLHPRRTASFERRARRGIGPLRSPAAPVPRVGSRIVRGSRGLPAYHPPQSASLAGDPTTPNRGFRKDRGAARPARRQSILARATPRRKPRKGSVFGKGSIFGPLPEKKTPPTPLRRTPEERAAVSGYRPRAGLLRSARPPGVKRDVLPRRAQRGVRDPSPWLSPLAGSTR